MSDVPATTRHKIKDRRRMVRPDGYVSVSAPNHPRANRDGYVLEHILVVEEALGKPLPQKHRVHHVNERRDDNRPENLVICENHSYHMFLHRQMKSRGECGDPWKRRCRLCGKCDDTKNLREHRFASFVHPACMRSYANRKYRERVAKGCSA